jgi:hypothetical protein
MTRHSGISIDDDGVTLVNAPETPGAGPTEVAFAPALLVLDACGHPVAGHRARRLAAAGTGAAFADFTLRVGDPVPVIGSDGSAQGAADLVALTISCLLRDQASPVGPGQHLTIAHPSGWGPYQVAELRAGLTRVGLDGLPTAFVPRAVAAVRTIGGGRADAVVVADLGRYRTEITTLRGGGVDGVRVDDLGSAELDRAVLSHVLGQLAGEPSDRDDLTARCRAARRELTGSPAAAVELPTTQGFERIRVTRAEFEESIRESVSVAVLNMCRELGDAAEKGAATYAVMIVGDGAEVPLLTQALSAEAGFGPDVAADRATAATGAALISGDRAKSGRAARQRMQAPVRPASDAHTTTGASSGPLPEPAARPRPLSAPSLPKPSPDSPAVPRPSYGPRVEASVRPRPAARAERPAYQEPQSSPAPRNGWPSTPPQRSGRRVRTAIVAAAAGIAVLIGGAAVTSGGGPGSSGGWHASRY